MYSTRVGIAFAIPCARLSKRFRPASIMSPAFSLSIPVKPSISGRAFSARSGMFSASPEPRNVIMDIADSASRGMFSIRPVYKDSTICHAPVASSGSAVTMDSVRDVISVVPYDIMPGICCASPVRMLFTICAPL